jgi:hypothetical protein
MPTLTTLIILATILTPSLPPVVPQDDIIITNTVEPLKPKKLDKIPDSDPVQPPSNSYKNYQKAIEVYEACQTSNECQTILKKFDKYGVNAKYRMALICNLESGWRTDVVSRTKDVGICQIHAPAHCRKLGFDPRIASEYLECVEALKDPETNLMIADQIYSRQGFKPWNARKYRVKGKVIFNVELLNFI